MYTQIVGCVIMGLLVRHKQWLFYASQSRFHRVMFVSLSSGLCGSITTFSSWQVEANKNFVLQWSAGDSSSSEYFATYNGGRLLEWLVTLWVGVALPLMALHLGQHLALLSPRHNEVLLPKVGQEDVVSNAQPHPALEAGLVVVFFASTVLVVVLPAVVFPSWVFLTYTAVFGAAGAYIRFLLSAWNLKGTELPWGTFTVNVFGSWLQAALWVLSKFYVGYYDVDKQVTAQCRSIPPCVLICTFCGCRPCCLVW